jgi:hypothetical protein
LELRRNINILALQALIIQIQEWKAHMSAFSALLAISVSVPRLRTQEIHARLGITVPEAQLMISSTLALQEPILLLLDLPARQTASCALQENTARLAQKTQSLIYVPLALIWMNLEPRAKAQGIILTASRVRQELIALLLGRLHALVQVLEAILIKAQLHKFLVLQGIIVRNLQPLS